MGYLVIYDPKERTETISELENIYNEILEDESLGIAELQEYCNENNIKFHHKAGKEKLIELIKNQ